ncbi:SpoIIE family protein phosphatase [Isoptericola variabilis]|uniref:Protein serine/threonine phosphatase with GAF(S) sensor(S) n=1 Tax=Isoptericola variabilis (strain 225) TaxID=743718 RepID=F6FVT2_ISOV2|nr:SpoIIE family protein phosphatase [Isoptericola variabilis]AEG45583.1 protein serine/threonine phosphatase with GAF(s) sensor(s) [Isoptericola variabilis 225]TWH25809.1 serine phosphatase RsbU (regulator of sigma subunit) [Isoptericola variabilis J7]
MTEPLVVGAQAGRGPAASVTDEVFDRVARLVHRHLDVIAAAVVLRARGELVLPGAVGLPVSTQAERVARVAEPVTALVVGTGAPVVVRDVEHDPRVDLDAVHDLGVAAFAAFPVHDGDGHAVGALWAVDGAPRVWTDVDLATLSDLAAACTSELRLRAERERARLAEQVAFRAHRRSRFLLGLSERFAGVSTVEEVEDALAHAVGEGTGARWVSLALVDDDRRHLTYVTVGSQEPGQELRSPRLDEPRPDTHVARTAQPLHFRDHDALVASYPSMAPIGLVSTGARSFLPVVTSGRVIGVVVCVWEHPREHDAEAAMLEAALGRYVALALERVALLETRRQVATTLQEALLTTAAPAVAHLDIATTYSPAARTDQVGGDWYDAVVLDDDAALLMIGDVSGHDVHAAAQMGQLRSMLRALAWSHDESPAMLLTLLDRANEKLGPRATATAVVARLDRDAPASDGAAAALPGDRSYTLTWSTAGHPPPLVLRSDGRVEQLAARADLMLGIQPATARTDHTARLHPGDTLVLYTDGLVEERGTLMSARIAELGRVLAASKGLATAALPRSLVKGLVGSRQRDDVAVLAVRVRVPVPSGWPSPAGHARAERRVADSLSDLGPARRWVDDVLECCEVDSEQRRTAMLLTSEVLTNALEHGRAPITVTVEVDDRRLRVGVRDGCTREPELKSPEPHDLSGRGVLFLERLASRWGVDKHEDSDAVGRHADAGAGKTVWFEIDRGSHPLTGAIEKVRKDPVTGAIPFAGPLLQRPSWDGSRSG